MIPRVDGGHVFVLGLAQGLELAHLPYKKDRRMKSRSEKRR